MENNRIYKFVIEDNENMRLDQFLALRKYNPGRIQEFPVLQDGTGGFQQGRDFISPLFRLFQRVSFQSPKAFSMMALLCSASFASQSPRAAAAS